MLIERQFYLARINRFAFVSATLISLFYQASAQERLVIIGGGKRPAAAMSKFVEWAGKDRARILVIAWATAEPQASFEALKKDLINFNPKQIELAPSSPLDAEKKEKFLNQLKNATAVFFTGGDQTKIMEFLRDETLLRALKQLYQDGVVFGGTSAGAAVMSAQMITGEGDFTVIDGAKVQTARGLGLLPENFIVDQHFIKRQRENRLFGLILQSPEKFGIGIDEETALLVIDNRYGEVVGASQIMTVAAQKRAGSLLVQMLRPGQWLDLRKRQPTAKRILK